MATSLPEEECDITKCSICLEEFKTPKYLPCLHTFCEACLNLYITSAFKTVSTNGSTKTDTGITFNCPVCRGSVKPADPSTPYQDWAGKFPLNHLIVTLIDQNKLKAKVKLCDPCKYDNDDVIAVMWCTDCNEALCDACKKSHKKSKQSRNHVLQNVDEIDSTPLITSLQTCVNHRGKHVDTFCVDHNVPCCTTCIAIHHRKCDHVTTLEEAAKGAGESDTFANLFTRLVDSSRLIDDALKKKRDNVVELEKQKSEIQEELKDLRQRINKHLDNLESKVMRELSSLHKQKVTELTEMINYLENKQKVIQNSKHLMSTCKKRANDIHVFLEMKKIEQKYKEQEDELKQIMTEHKKVEYQIERNSKAEEIISDVKCFGTVIVKENDDLSGRSGSVMLKDCLPNKISSISISGTYFVHGGKFLPDNTLMLPLLDGHKLVKMSTDGHVVQHGGLSGNVYDVTMIDTKTAVVTRPNQHAIDFVDIQSLRVTRSVSTSDKCYGIIHDENKLYIGCHNKLLIMNENGDTLKEIKTETGLNAITIIKVGDKKIVYVSCNSSSFHFIRISDMEEIHKFTHKDLQSPCCVTSDRDGNVYMTGYSLGNVFQVSPEAKLIKIILTGIDRPIGIQFDGDSNRFFISFYSITAKVDIYEMIKPGSNT